MKCGLIWARSARSSASTVRVRAWASSASSTWPDTQPAVSWVARTRAAEGASGTYATSAPDHDVVGDRTAPRPRRWIGQAGSAQRSVAWRRIAVRPVRSASAACLDRIAGVAARRRRPTPACWSVSTRATAAVPSSARRCRAARCAPCGVRPSRSPAAAEDAVCSVRKVASSESGAAEPPGAIDDRPRAADAMPTVARRADGRPREAHASPRRLGLGSAAWPTATPRHHAATRPGYGLGTMCVDARARRLATARRPHRSRLPALRRQRQRGRPGLHLGQRGLGQQGAARRLPAAARGPGGHRRDDAQAHRRVHQPGAARRRWSGRRP